MCGERRTTEEDGRLFFDFVDVINYTGSPKFNGLMTVFPFLKYGPGPYGDACRRIVEMRAKLVDKFLTKQRVRHHIFCLRSKIELFSIYKVLANKK